MYLKIIISSLFLISFLHFNNAWCVRKKLEGNLFYHLFACYKSSDYKTDLQKAPVSTLDMMIVISNISKIENNTFDKFPMLRMLALIANDIEEIEDHAFRNLSGLTTLMIVANNLRELKGVWFEKLPMLEMINLADNNFETIDDKFGEVIGRLTTNVVVDLSNNYLKRLPDNINEFLDGNILVKNNPWHFRQELFIMHRIQENVMYSGLDAIRDSIYNASMKCNSTLPANISDDDFDKCAIEFLQKQLEHKS